MEVIACQCEEGFGLPHTHVSAKYIFRRQDDGLEIKWDRHTIELNTGLLADYDWIGFEDASVRMWVNWKAVTRALMNDVVSPTDQGEEPS